MGAASKAVLVVVRVWQLICSVIVLGILAAFMNRLHNANGPKDGRIIYSIVTASISTAFSIIFIAPFFYSFLAFPFDFVLFVMWLVAFCLLESRVGIHTCSSSWFTNYWGFYWGRWWRRRPVVVTGPVNSGCGQWRTVLAFSFMAMFAFIVSTILGAYVVSNRRDKNRKSRTASTTAMAENPEASQIGGPAPVETAGQTGGVVYTEPGTGQPATYHTAP